MSRAKSINANVAHQRYESFRENCTNEPERRQIQCMPSRLASVMHSFCFVHVRVQSMRSRFGTLIYWPARPWLCTDLVRSGLGTRRRLGATRTPSCRRWSHDHMCSVCCTRYKAGSVSRTCITKVKMINFYISFMVIIRRKPYFYFWFRKCRNGLGHFPWRSSGNNPYLHLSTR